MILSFERGGRIQTLEFDATIRELHLGTAEVTKHPMQKGVDISDHVRPDQVRLTAELFVTNHPIRSVGGVNSAARVVGQVMPLVLETRRSAFQRYASVSGGPGFTLPLPGRPTVASTPVTVTPAVRVETPNQITLNVLQFPVAFDRVRLVHRLLDDFRREGQVLQVLDALMDYDQMVLTSVSAPRTSEDAVSFTCEFVELRFGTAELLEVPVPLEGRAKPKKAQGPKATYALSEQKASTLSHASEYVQSKIFGQEFRPL